MADSTTESRFRFIFKEFLLPLSDTNPLWYSFKRTSDGVPNLLDLLDMSNDQMMSFLHVCGLTDPSGTNILSDKVQDFIISNGLQKVVEHTRTKIKSAGSGGAQVHHHAFCIGDRKFPIGNKPGREPKSGGGSRRIPSLSRLQKQLKESIMSEGRQLVGDTMYQKIINVFYSSGKLGSLSSIIDAGERTMKQEEEGNVNNHDEEECIVAGDSVELERGGSPVGTSNIDDNEDDLLYLRVPSRLLPMLLNEKQSVSREELEVALVEIVGEIQDAREKRVTAIVGSQEIDVSPNSKQSPTKYPVMKRYGIPLGEARVHQGLLKELYQLNKKSLRTRSMFVDLGDNKKSSFVLIPQSHGYNRLRVNETKHKWFGTLMSALGGEGNEASSARDLFIHVSRQEQFREKIIEGVKQSGIRTFPHFDPISTFAMQSAANLNESQLAMLRRCCKAECGDYLFSSPFQIQRVLDLEHVLPLMGTLTIGTEKIPWMYKSVIEIVCLYMKTLLCESKGTLIARRVDVSVCVDHGKGHSRATMLVVARFWNDGVWTKRQQSFSVGSARCKKDSAEIVSGTFGERLNDDLNYLKAAGLVSFFKKNGGGNLFEDGYVMVGGQNVPDDAVWIGEAVIELFMSGDLLWFHTALGKEGYQSWWCPYCSAFKNDWQEKNHEAASAWTLDSLKEQARRIAAGELRKKNAREVLGVKDSPIFDAMEVDHYVVPVLHLTIGLTNDVLDHLVCECQAAAERFTTAYYILEGELARVTQDLGQASVELGTFMADKKEYIKDCRRRLRTKHQMTREQAATLDEEWDQFNGERRALQENLDNLKIAKERAEAKFQDEGNKAENSKQFGQPVRAFVDNVLRKRSIDRAVQHGGKLEGNQCRKLLRYSKEILLEIKEFVLSRPAECRVVGSDTDIEEVFSWHEFLLIALDGVLSGLRTPRYEVNDEIIGRTDEFRIRVLRIARYLGKRLRF